MPELPEVETIARAIEPDVVGRTILSADVFWARTLATPSVKKFKEMVKGQKVTGVSRRQALKDMSDRMDLPDVTSFVATILQAEQLGVSIGKVLRIQSEQMRIKRRQRAEEKAQQAPVKMLFPMVFLIFPAMFVVLLGPAILRVVRTDALKSVTG